MSEIGPIRPPSEAHSLLVRVTRNCPWNRCAFCPVYRGTAFSIRSVDEVLADIDELFALAQTLRQRALDGRPDDPRSALLRLARDPFLPPSAGQVALFLFFGGHEVFLQDANSLAMRPRDLVRVLAHLRLRFPEVTRITSYARAHTLTRRSPEELASLRQAGLTRVHVGLESGSDAVLALVRKGVDSARQIEAGLRAKAAGFELSEYYMPGLGGRTLSRDHALQSARVLSAIDPHVIRLRTTAVQPGSDLDRLVEQGVFAPMGDEDIIAELRLFVEHLDGRARVVSDHLLNLLPELQGTLPEDKGAMLALLDTVLDLPPRLRRAFVIGRRAGVLNQLSDLLHSPEARERALRLLDRVDERYGGDLDAAVRDFMSGCL